MNAYKGITVTDFTEKTASVGDAVVLNQEAITVGQVNVILIIDEDVKQEKEKQVSYKTVKDERNDVERLS